MVEIVVEDTVFRVAGAILREGFHILFYSRFFLIVDSFYNFMQGM